MRARFIAPVLLFVALSVPTCQPAAEPIENDVAAIQGMVKAYHAAAEVSDVAGLVALRTDDVVQYPPDGPVSRGKQALEEFYTGIFEHSSFSATWPVEGTEEIVVADGWAFYISEFILTITPKAGGGPFEDRGKIIILCEKQPDGSWLWAHEIWNRNSPPST